MKITKNYLRKEIKNYLTENQTNEGVRDIYRTIKNKFSNATKKTLDINVSEMLLALVQEVNNSKFWMPGDTLRFNLINGLLVNMNREVMTSLGSDKKSLDLYRKSLGDIGFNDKNTIKSSLYYLFKQYDDVLNEKKASSKAPAGSASSFSRMRSARTGTTAPTPTPPVTENKKIFEIRKGIFKVNKIILREAEEGSSSEIPPELKLSQQEIIQIVKNYLANHYSNVFLHEEAKPASVGEFTPTPAAEAPPADAPETAAETPPVEAPPADPSGEPTAAPSGEAASTASVPAAETAASTPATPESAAVEAYKTYEIDGKKYQLIPVEGNIQLKDGMSLAVLPNHSGDSADDFAIALNGEIPREVIVAHGARTTDSDTRLKAIQDMIRSNNRIDDSSIELLLKRKGIDSTEAEIRQIRKDMKFTRS